MVAPTATAAPVVAACTRLIAALPATLGPDIARRPVTGDVTRTAAWGDPPITLVCGVGRPDQNVPPLTVDGVPWVVTDTGPGQLWTTRNRSVNVAVDINDAYPGQGEIIVRLAAPVLASLPGPEALPGG